MLYLCHLAESYSNNLKIPETRPVGYLIPLLSSDVTAFLRRRRKKARTASSKSSLPMGIASNRSATDRLECYGGKGW